MLLYNHFAVVVVVVVVCYVLHTVVVYYSQNCFAVTILFCACDVDVCYLALQVATCCYADQVVDPCYFDYGRTSYQCAYSCTEDDVLTSVKKEYINGRLDWVEGYFAT